jgi:hypothetical protein
MGRNIIKIINTNIYYSSKKSEASSLRRPLRNEDFLIFMDLKRVNFKKL